MIVRSTLGSDETCVNNTIGSLIWLRLIRFTNQSNQMSNEFLKRFDLTTAQFDVLMQIRIYQPLNTNGVS